MRNQILTVGSLALDTIKTPYDVHERVLGGSVSYFSFAASLFSNVSIISCVGKDLPERYWKLFNDRNINTENIEIKDGKTFFWEGEYFEDLEVRKTHETQINVFEDFKPRIKNGLTETNNVFLANIDPELQCHVLDQLSGPTCIACDTMNLWLDTKRDTFLELLKKVTILFINEEEARMLGKSSLMMEIISYIHDLGPSTIVIKRGARGAILSHDGIQTVVPAYPFTNLKDPTGAGDTFAGGFMGYLSNINKIDRKNLIKAMLHGTVAASFCVEEFSVNALLPLDMKKFTQRYEHLNQMLSLER